MVFPPEIVFYCLYNDGEELKLRKQNYIDLADLSENLEDHGYYKLCSRKELSNLLGGAF